MCLAGLSLLACKKEEDVLSQLIANDPYLSSITNNPAHEVRIIYTQVDRDSRQEPAFKTFSYQPDTFRYFYPASTVKLPAALLSLEKLKDLGIEGLDKNATMLTDSAASNQRSFHTDSTSENWKPSVGHYIKKILLVSDNEAYNRLYEFLGQDYFNKAMISKGYTNTRINHRLSEYVPRPRTREENLTTNPVRFLIGDSLIYSQPLIVSKGIENPESPILRGKGFIRNDSLINEPFDFAYKNYFHLIDQHNLLLALFFPEQFEDGSFDLTRSDYDFIYKYMSIFPGESDLATYQDGSKYPDAWVKFLLFGAEEGEMPRHIRIFNKVGDAYGYLIDNAYIIDMENGIEFFLSAVIHVNSNQIYNDGNYEYDEVGFPFMKQLGRKIYNYELDRDRPVRPDFSYFQSLYE